VNRTHNNGSLGLSRRPRLAGAVGALVAMATLAVSGAALAAPSAQCAFSVETAPMVGEAFTGSLSLTNGGDTPGFVPAYELITPPEITLTGATFSGFPATITKVGVFAGGAPLTNPLTGQSVSGPDGATYYFLTIPVSSQGAGAPAMEVALAFSQGATVVGDTYPITGSCQYAFGADANNNPGADPPDIAPGGTEDVVPVFAKFRQIALQIGAAVMIQGPSFPASFDTIVDVADGRTLDTATVAVQVPDGFIVTGVSSDHGTATLVSPGNPSYPLAAGTDLTVSLAGVAGTASDTDETLHVQGYWGEFQDDGTTPLIDPCTADGAPRVYTADVSNITGGADTQADEQLTFPTVVVAWAVLETITNQSRPGEVPRPGDTQAFDLNVVVSDYFEFDGNSLESVLQDGLSYNDDAVPADVGDTDQVTSWIIDFDLPDLVGPVTEGQQTIHYTADVDEYYEDGAPDKDPVLLGTTILTKHTITGTPSPACGVERSDDEASGPRDENVTLATGALDKSVYAINGDTNVTSTELQPGDTVTYRLRLTMAQGDAFDTVVHDFLPLPLHDVSEISGAAGAPFDGGTHPLQFGPDHATDGAGNALPVGTVPAPASVDYDATNNEVSITFGPIHTDPTGPVVLDLLLTVTVQACQYGDLSLFTNIGVAEFNGGATVTDFGLTNVTLREPALHLYHGAVAIDLDNTSPNLVGSVGVDLFNPQITSQTLAANPVAATAIADAGDEVQFAIVVENASDATAYDLGVTIPSFPSKYTNIVYLGATDGDGDAVPGVVGDPTTGQLHIDTLPSLDAAAGTGDNIVIALYSAELAANVEGRDNLPITARLNRWTSLPAGATQGCAALTPITATTSARVPDLATSKTRTSPEPVRIRCDTITYTVTVTVPEGVHENVTIEDRLQDGHLGFVGVVSASSGVPLANPGALASPTVSGGGDIVTWDLGTLTNPDRDNTHPEIITITYEAVVLNTSAVNRGDNLQNRATTRWGSGRSTTAQTSGLHVAEPTLHFANEVLNPALADGGDTVSVDFDLSHTGASNSDAQDVVWTLTLPPEVQNLANFTVTGPPTSSITTTATGATVTWSTLQVGPPPHIHYTVDVVPGVALGATAEITGAVTWTGCPGTPAQAIADVATSVERDGTGTPSYNDYRATSGRRLDIQQPGPQKGLVGAQTDFAVGDTFEYQLGVVIPEGTTPTLQLTDTLPAGLAFVSLVAGSFHNDGGVLCGGVVCTEASPSVSGGTLTFTWSDLDNPPDADTEVFTWRILVRVDNVSVSQAGVSLVNAASVSGQTASAVAVRVIEPQLTVAATSTTPAGDGTVDAGDVVTYTVTVTNTGNATAYDGLLDATLAGMIAGGTATVTEGTCTPSVTNPDADQVRVALSPLAPGARCVFTVTGTTPDDVAPGATLGAASGQATWTSQPGDDPNERTGADGPGGALNDYALSGVATPSLTVPQASVAVALDGTGSAATTGAGGADAVAPGETVTYAITVTLPEGQGDVVITDAAPAGVTLQSVQVSDAGDATLANATPSVDANGAIDLGTVTRPASGGETTDTITLLVTGVAGEPVLSDGTNGVTLAVNGADVDTASAPFDAVNPAPEIALTAADTTPARGADDVVTATVTNAGDGPVCDTTVTVQVPAPTIVRALETDGLDNDADGAADATDPQGDEGALAAGGGSYVFPVVGCLDPGASRSFPIEVVAPLGADPLPPLTATLGDYHTLPAADDGGLVVAPDGDGHDTDRSGSVDEAGDEVVALTLTPVDGPLAQDDVAQTPEGTAVTVDVAGNDLPAAPGDVLTTGLIVGGPGDGDVTVNTDGTVTYTPDAGFVGTDTFDYEVCDGAGQCAVATVEVTVTPTDRAPVLVDDARTTPADTPVAIAVLANDEDGDALGAAPGGALTLVTAGNPLHGQVSVAADGTVTYTPEAGFTGTDTFSYTAVDDEGNTATASVTITVGGTGADPVAGDDAATTPEDTPTTLDLLANDVDPDDDALTVTALGQPAHGGLTDHGDGTVTYTPDADFAGEDVFVYAVCDATGCDVATATVTVEPAGDAPIALDDHATTAQDAAVSIDAGANDGDPDVGLGGAVADGLTLAVTIPPAHGAVTSTAPGVFEYTPEAGFSGTDVFAYESCDDDGQCDTALVFVDVIPPAAGDGSNAPPAVSDDAYTLEAGGSLGLDAFANDGGDPDGDPTYVQRFTAAQHGTVALDPTTGEFLYTPEAGFAGEDFFYYAVCDDHGACAQARVDLTVDGNEPPTPQADAVSTPEDTAVSLSPLTNDDDPDGDALTLDAIVSPPAHGTAVVDGEQVVYTPEADFHGTDAFTYRVCDPAGLCATETVTVEVTPVNDAPVALDDAWAVPADATTPLDVALNDQDVDGDALALLANSEPAHGVLVPSTTPDGRPSFDYTPDAGYAGPDTFTYLACDPAGLCDEATVTLEVGGANGNPEAVDDAATTPEETPVVVAVLDNDSDPDGDGLTVASATTPAHGQVTVLADGTVLYAPDGDFAGTDSFLYTVCDAPAEGAPACATAEVVVDVTPVNDPPVAVDDAASVAAGQPATVTPADNDSDPDGDVLTVTAVTQPAHGVATLAGDGTVTYTPEAGFVGDDAFDYTVCDPSGACDTATVRVAVGAAENLPPVAQDDAVSTDAGQPVDVAVLANDSDPEGEALTVTVAGAGAHGQVAIVAGANGDEIRYAPEAGFVGVDSFDYTTCDPAGLCSTATVTVTVGEPPNEPPVGGDDEALTHQDTSVSLDVLANDEDPDGDAGALTVASVGAPVHGTAALQADGTILYTPGEGFVGVDHFTYEVCDAPATGTPACDTVNVVVTVVDTNDPPVARDDARTVPAEAPTTLDVTANDQDPEGEDLALLVTSAPAHGQLAADDAGGLIYTSDAGYAGADSFTYTVCDPAGLCDEATVTLDVTSGADGDGNPVAADDAAGTDEGAPVVVAVLDNDTDPDGDPLVVSQVGTASHGAVVVEADGTLTYTPEPGFAGEDSFPYTVCDQPAQGAVSCDTARVVVTVAPSDEAPVAVDDVAQTVADTAVSLAPLDNDEDPDGDELVVTALGQPAHGVAIVNADGTVTYTPDAGFTGVERFSYEACDFHPTLDHCEEATITIFVEGGAPNEAPAAADDSATTEADTSVVVDLFANDQDPEGGALDLTELESPGHGSVARDPANPGEVTYTPEDGFVGEDTFAYEICDDHGQCDRAVVTVTVGTPNGAPAGVDDEAATEQGVGVTLNVLANDADPDGDPLTVTAAGEPAHGTVVVNPDGTVTYTPDAGFVGTDTFPYTVCDDAEPAACDEVAVKVVVADVNEAPVAGDDAWTVPSDAPTALPVLDNDGDPDGDALTLLPTGSPAHGSVTVDADGTLTYTPEGGYAGPDSFTYTVCDGDGLCDEATVSLDVGGPNGGPEAVDDAAETTEGASVAVDVLANDTDPDAGADDGPLVVTQVGAPGHGEAVLEADGTVTYTPEPGFAGQDSFVYTVCDQPAEGTASCDTAEVVVTVTGQDDAPAALDDVATTAPETPVTLDVLANDVESDGEPLHVGALSQPAHGEAVVNPDGTVTYTPEPGYEGEDELTYTACDPAGQCAQATLRVVVTAEADQAPTAQDDAAVTDVDTPVDVAVLDNDSDPDDGDALTVASAGAPAHGGVVLNADGTVTYTPEAGFEGEDTFPYAVCDARGLCDEAVVTITVGALNGAPVGGDDEAETSQDTPVTLNVLANDSDPDGAPLTVTGTSEPTHGAVVVNPDGTLTYSPALGFVGTDTFTYTVCDDAEPAACDDVVVTVTVTDVNDPPVAGDDRVSVPADAATAVDVLANDTDPDGDALTLDGPNAILAPPAHGIVTVNDDGTVTYTPEDGFVGDDAFTYEVCDPAGLCDQAQVTLHVGDGNTTPEAVDDAATTAQGVAVDVVVLDNDTDADGDALAVDTVGAPAHGTATVAEDGTVTYTPEPGFAGEDSFPYTVCDAPVDEGGACATATVTVTVTGADDPPVAVDDVVTTQAGVAVTLAPAGNDVEPDGEPLHVAALSQPAHGTAIVNADGTVTYTPDDGFEGEDSFPYTVCDPGGQCAQATVTVLVDPADAAPNEGPVAQDDVAQVGAEPVAVDVLANDSDPEGGALVVTEVTQPAHGTVRIDADGTVTYTPDETLGDAVDSFDYEVCDDHGNCDRATVVVNPNEPPLGLDDHASTPRDTAVTIVVLANDADPDGDVVGVGAVTQDPANGDAVVNEDGSVTYTPRAGFTGTDTFHYEVCDPRGFCDDVVVVVVVEDAPAAPVPGADYAATPTDTPVDVAVLDNDRDPNGDEPLTVSDAGPAEHGTVEVQDDGTVTYTPEDGYTGDDSFPYTVCDAAGMCATGTVRVVVGSDDGGPTPQDDAATVDEDDAVVVDVLGNDSDPDGDALTVVEAGAPAHGTATVNEDGTVTYTPDADFAGEDSFVYTVCDGAIEDGAACASAVVTVTVEPSPDPIEALDDEVCAGAAETLTLTLAANDVDPDGEALTVVAVGEPLRGTASLEADGTVVYTPPADAAAGELDRFGYTVADPQGYTAQAEVVIRWTDAAGDLVGEDDSYVVGFDEALALDVLGNDAGPAGAALAIVAFTDPAHGTVTLGADGVLTYAPDAGYFGADTFRYEVSDGGCGQEGAVVTLQVGDEDADGLSDPEEAELGTDPTVVDSDGDGLTDFEEVHGTGPLAEWAPTDPMDADSDDDGIGDGDEVTGARSGGVPLDPNAADTDGDGLSDGTEVGVTDPVPGGTTEGGLPFQGTDEGAASWAPDEDPATTTDPTDADSDDDGLDDGAEDANHNGRVDNTLGATGTVGEGESDPLNPDTDGDTLSDGDEVNEYGTSPVDTDTDDGSVEDGAEVSRGTDPLDAEDDVDDLDTDGDGLLDSEEATVGTDPNDPDSDQDGLLDGDEVHNQHTNPLEPDTDGGGMTDGDEVLRGTDPLDPADDGHLVLHGGSCAGAGGSPPLGAALGLLLAWLLAWRRRRRAA